MNSGRKCLVTAFVVGVALGGTGSLWATDYYFANAGGGNFTNPANWFPLGVPGAADNTYFTNQGGNTVSFTVNMTNANVLVNDFTWQQFAIGNYTWWVTNSFVIAGANAPSLQGAVMVASGLLAVTNAAGNGTLYLSAGPGLVDVTGGGTLTVDRFSANNNSANQILVDNGTLNILHGSVFSNYNAFYIGQTTPSTLNILGGTNVTLASGLVYDGRPDHPATLNVVGPGTVWSNASYTWLAGGSKMVVSNGGTYISGAAVAYLTPRDGSISNASLVVTGPNSAYNLNSLYIGATGGNASNQLTLADGAHLTSSGDVILDYAGVNLYNTILVTGTGTVMHVGGVLDVSAATSSSAGHYNQLIVSNGATVKIDDVNNTAHPLNIGYGAGTGSSNTVIITGPGSIVQLTSGGYALLGGPTSNEWMFINDGGTLEANRMLVQNLSFINNNGGVFQFTTASPGEITATAGSSISLTNGTISFRGISNADVFSDTAASGNQIAHITMGGANTFELNSASNRSDVAQNYVFNTGLGATNYANLELTGAGSRWNSAALTIGSGGSLVVTNATATVAASVTNEGILRVTQSRLTFRSNVVVTGHSISDRSTNTFNGDVTVTSSGASAGGPGDLFDFKKSLFINNSSNPTGAFNLASSTVSFSGGGLHTNAVTGADLGHDATNGFAFGFTAQNFSYGRLTLGSTNDPLQMTSGDGAASNALYVTALDLSAFQGDYSSASQAVSSLLFAPTDLNIYYRFDDPANAWLGDQVYPLFSAPGGGLGGLLLPAVPEPSTLMLLAFLAGAWVWRRKPKGT